LAKYGSNGTCQSQLNRAWVRLAYFTADCWNHQGMMVCKHQLQHHCSHHLCHEGNGIDHNAQKPAGNTEIHAVHGCLHVLM
jgi:hypothetical protein